jgi:hypothetical protein
MSIRRPLITVTLIATACSLGFAACTRAPTDQFVAGLTTQVQVPRDLQSVVIRISKANSNLFCKAYPVIDGVARLPQSLGTSLPLDAERNLPIEIRVLGIEATPDSDQGLFNDECSPIDFGRGKARVLRRSLEQYQEGRKLYIPMPLMYSCFDVKCTGVTDTCKGGVCSPVKQSPAGKLKDYVKNQELGQDNLCFRIKTRDGIPGCMDTQLPPKLIDADKCIYEIQDLPGVPFVGINVATVYEGGYVSELLDAEPEEGFSVPDVAKPRQFQLAAGLCAKVKAAPGDISVAHTISAVLASGTCPSKTQNQAICAADTVAQTADDKLGISGPGQLLRTTKSALAVLIDGTKANEQLFGAQGLAQTILNVGLQDPQLQRIAMAPLILPQGNGCTPTPTLGFADGADKVRDAFQTLVGGGGALPPAVNLGLDAMLDPVYQQVLAQSGVDRRAVIVLGNGGFGAGCGKPDAPAQLAAKALAKGVSTYVILTGEQRPAANTDAADLAREGRPGGTAAEAFGDGQAASGKGLEAFANVAADLTSCRYEAPQGTKNTQKIAYFDAKSQSEVVVSSVPACAAGAGWTTIGTVIQLCGTTCDTMKQSLKQTLVSSYIAGTTLSATPVYLRDAK